jgi:glycosyltransferase involved in cell wall biosynthesis
LLIVTPCRDEARYARATLDSVLSQRLLPAAWIIVDDGSTDETPRILAEYATRHPLLRIVRRSDRGGRSVGPGVVDAFYAGLQGVELAEYDYLCKLDLDLELPADYFEQLIERMELDPRLGTASGKPYQRAPDGRLVAEPVGDEMSAGMTKLYRTRCFVEIGGFVREVMWDGIDCHRARMLGWRARSYDDPKLRFVHLRAMGSSQKGILTGRARHGRGQYFMGTGPFYLLVSAVFRMATAPYVIGGIAIAWGYFAAQWSAAPRYQDRAFRAFLRRYQRECLWYGKRRATERVEIRCQADWRAEPVREARALERAP